MRAFIFVVSFLLAFLLFAVQPMATKLVLPTLGGTPAVWNTVMFTFQLLLLTGYVYAALLAQHVRARWQLPVHALLVAVACLLLPLNVKLEANDSLVNHPIWALVVAFLSQIGLLFLCLSATAPLLQSWVSHSNHPLAKTPYVLYSASNLGSFSGLLGYILLVEPLLDLSQQRYYWSILFVISMAALLFVGGRLRFTDAAPDSTYDESAATPSFRLRLVWMLLAFLPSSLSLGVTTYIATDVASIPLLWVIPLSIYLLSFVDAFRSRPLLVPVCQCVAPLLGLFALLVYGLGGHGIVSTYLLQLITFFILAFALHGWLARYLPAKRYLTQFYVYLSIGGLLGGVLNGLIAPILFRDALEYPIVLLIASVTAFVILMYHRDSRHKLSIQLRSLIRAITSVFIMTIVVYVGWMMLNGLAVFTHINSLILAQSALSAGLVVALVYRCKVQAFYAASGMVMMILIAVDSGIVGYTQLFKDRNFFGVSRVLENSTNNARYFMHDTTMHGLQSLDGKQALTPQAYYSVLVDIFRTLPDVHQHPLAVVGMGVGTLKCLTVENQEVDLYEINPMVRAIAENPAFFTYMRDCPGVGKIIMGDGRISMSHQPDKRYGVIILDAFTSDAVPAHLLTREAIAMYVRKLVPGGLILMNTTNRHIDLWPLIALQAKSLGLASYGKFFRAPESNVLLRSSYWAVVARAPGDVSVLLKQQTGWQVLTSDEGGTVWTDNYISLLPYFKALR